MSRRYYSKRHFERLANGAADSAEQAAERVRERALRERAHQETLSRFEPLTTENVRDALAWQDARIRELLEGDQ